MNNTTAAMQYHRVTIVTAYIFRHELIMGEKPTIDELVTIFKLPREEIAEIVDCLKLVEEITKEQP